MAKVIIDNVEKQREIDFDYSITIGKDIEGNIVVIDNTANAIEVIDLLKKWDKLLKEEEHSVQYSAKIIKVK